MSSKLFNIIRELQENEQNYVRSLGNGIKIYMSVMDQNEFDNFPRTLRGQKFRVFGNIFSIYKFHCDEFFPRLVECGEDVEQIAELFTSYVTRDFFYAYVIYAINRKKSELLCHYHNSFWKVKLFKFILKFYKTLIEIFRKFKINPAIDLVSTVFSFNQFKDFLVINFC